MSDQLVI